MSRRNFTILMAVILIIVTTFWIVVPICVSRVIIKEKLGPTPSPYYKVNARIVSLFPEGETCIIVLEDEKGNLWEVIDFPDDYENPSYPLPPAARPSDDVGVVECMGHFIGDTCVLVLDDMGSMKYSDHEVVDLIWD